MEQLEESGKNFKDYLMVILARKWIVLSVFLVVTGAAIYYAETSPPVYKAMSVLMREPNSMSESVFETMSPYYYREPWTFVENLRRLMRTRAVEAAVVKRLSEEWNIDSSIGEVRESTSLTNPEETNVLEITATSDDPNRAAALANVVAQVFIEKTSEMRSADLDRAVEFLSEQLRLVDENLRQSEERLNAFREKEGIIAEPDSSGYGRASLMSQLANLQEELSWTESEKELVQAQLSSVRDLMAEKKKQLAITEEVDLLVGSVTPQIEQLQSKIADWQLELATLQETFTDKHYKVVELKDRIAEAQHRLQSEIAGLVAERSVNPISEWQNLVNRAVQLYVQLKGHEHKEKLAATKIEVFKREHPDLLEKEVQLVRLEREARIREKTYMLLTDRYEETLLLKQVNAQEFSVVDDAIPPKYPVGPRKMRIITLGTLLGLMLGVATALFLEYMDDSVRRGEDVEKYLGLPVVGLIPKIQTAKVPLSFPEAIAGFAVQDPSNADLRRVRRPKRKHRKRLEELQGRLVANVGLKSPMAESYRSLWTNIQFANVDKPVETMLVTSPGPREGKSLTAANLALTMAQTGIKVLVIDTDLRRPAVHRLFGYRRSPGLSELIASDLSNMGEFVRNTYADNLYILTCGDLPPNPVGILGSEKMKRLIEEAKNQFDTVLFDSPPLIAMADSSVLATELDATLLVLQAGHTKRQVANQAKELLQRLNINISGVVLNNIDYSKRYGYYGYYYYYYHHYRDYYTQEGKDEVV